MTKTRTVDNTNRPAQPEPGEKQTAMRPVPREDASAPGAEDMKREERERQAGE